MFTKFGRIAGIGAVAIGIAAIIGSFVVAPDVLAADFDRTSMEQSTLWFSQGSALVFFGLVLGVLCEISLKLDK
ncbi:hypothetical protein NBRC116586_08140 [Pseudooceanicola nitratireducens]